MAETTAMFEEAVRKHSARLMAVARNIAGHRASAEDIVQQALLNLYQHRDRYNWNDAGGLMRRAVVNEALRILRQPKVNAVADDHPGPLSEPVNSLLDSELVEKVRAAINRLPDGFRAALVLCEYEEMSYAEIAELLDCSIPQIKTWLHRGRRRLADMLRDFDRAEPVGRRSTSDDLR